MFANKKSLKSIFILTIAIALFFGKLEFNNLLKAENGDTYSFFKIAYFLEQGTYIESAKRLPLLPLLLTLGQPDTYVSTGRIIVTFFYFASIYVFYLFVRNFLNEKSSILASIVFAFNIVVFDNSMFIMSDPLFLFFCLLFLVSAIKNPNNIFKLTIIGTFAFYTRIEGLFLFGSLGLYHLINRNYKKMFQTGLGMTLSIAPYLYRNMSLFGTPFYSGYSSDSAGFTLTPKNIFLAISNLAFGLGGFWALPILVNKKNSFKKLPLISNILLVSLSLLLILWAPAIRLYSVPITILIGYAFYFLENNDYEINSSAILLTVLGVIGYIAAVQFLNHKDIGMFKISKIISIVFSLGIIWLLYFNKAKNITLVVITVLVCLINLIVFGERFNHTRFKYRTIIEAVEYYKTELIENGNLGYLDESGVQQWYLKDFEKKYSFLDSNNDMQTWILENDIEYLLFTHELGYVPKEVEAYKSCLDQMEVVKKFESPFFGGETELIKVNLDLLDLESN